MDFGAQQLIKQGWQQGRGLGSQGQGRVSCITAFKKKGFAGLGSKGGDEKIFNEKGEGWWETAFKTSLDSFHVKLGDNKKKRSERKGKRHTTEHLDKQGLSKRVKKKKLVDGVKSTTSSDAKSVEKDDDRKSNLTVAMPTNPLYLNFRRPKQVP